MSEHAAVATASSTSCRNCSTDLTGEYCHGCGEPRPSHHEFQWKHMVHEATHEFLHLDGKIFRTLWRLISRAGFLTQEYWNGRRTPYIRPLRLYIVIAAVHLLVMSHTFYRMDLFKARDSQGNLTAFIQRIADRNHATLADTEAAINVHLSKAYSIAQYGAVLGFALFPWLLYRRRRQFYVQHLIFALHTYSFYYLLTAGVSLFISPSQWMRSPMPLVTLAYIAFAVRRLYNEDWRQAIWKAIFLRLGLFVSEAFVLAVALTYGIYQVRYPAH